MWKRIQWSWRAGTRKLLVSRYEQESLLVGAFANLKWRDWLTCPSVSSPFLSQLKTIDDSRKIRNRVLSNFEEASLPTCTPEQRKKLLSFVVCGGGPTGVEFASELYDMINEDVLDYVCPDWALFKSLIFQCLLLLYWSYAPSLLNFLSEVS